MLLFRVFPIFLEDREYGILKTLRLQSENSKANDPEWTFTENDGNLDSRDVHLGTRWSFFAFGADCSEKYNKQFECQELIDASLVSLVGFPAALLTCRFVMNDWLNNREFFHNRFILTFSNRTLLRSSANRIMRKCVISEQWTNCAKRRKSSDRSIDRSIGWWLRNT